MFMSSYMSIVIHQIISEFKFVERNDLFHPLLSSTGWVRVNVYPPGYTGVCFACDQPLRTVERVPIAFIVHWYEVHHKDILSRGVQTL